MRVCVVVEGSYPYVGGGVSGWIHSLIQSFPQLEFVLLTVVSDRSRRGQFVYELPANVTEVYEAYVNDEEWIRRWGHRYLAGRETAELRHLILDQKVDWNILFDFFQSPGVSLNDVLMGPQFLRVVQDTYALKYSQIPFSDFLWTMRSIYLPLFLTLRTPIPRADIYHCLSTGYAGVLGAMAHYLYPSRLILSEHGIYTREREEDLLQAKWLKGIYKDIWIAQFHKMSALAYERADRVTALYARASEFQKELGCPETRTVRNRDGSLSEEKVQIVIPNGIHLDRFQSLPGKPEEDADRINIGAVLRIVPIKDVKTLLRAFHAARSKDARLKLWVMGPWNEDREYAQECFDLVADQAIPDVTFTGRVDVREYLGRMDMTVLTSISEAQPLTILESFAAGKPVISTDVGSCRDLILGEEDDSFGPAGIVTHIMSVPEISRALLTLAADAPLRMKMGENGRRRVQARYRYEQMTEAYRDVYQTFARDLGVLWPEDGVQMGPSQA